MKTSWRLTVLFLVGIGVSLFVAGKGMKPAVVWSAGEVKWVESPAMKGLSVATLWGDPNRGAYGALKKVTGGTEFGWHTHTYEQKVVAISGTFDFQMEGGATKELGSGSYVYVPAGAKHTAKCREGADCVYFEESPGKSDYKPATPPAM